MIPILVTIFAALCCLDWYMRKQPTYLAAISLPGPPIYPLIGNLIDSLSVTQENFLQILRQKALNYKKAYRGIYFNQLHYYPIRCHEVEFLLSSSTHINKGQFHRFLEPMLGCGLLCSAGTKWAHRRKILTPAYHFNILPTFLTTFQEHTSDFVLRLAAEVGKPNGTKIHEFITRFTLHNICETAMGVKLNHTTEPDRYRDMIDRCGALVMKRIVNPQLYNNTIFSWTSTYRELMKGVRELHAFSGSIIAERRGKYRQQKRPEQHSDNIYEQKTRYAMLDTLFEAESAGQIDAAGIQEEVDTFMFEGYDTTSCGITYCLFAIGMYADVQQKMHEEIVSVVAESGGGSIDRLGVNDYGRMQYMDRVIKETFRLYPPVPFITRPLQESVDLGHAILPAGTNVHVLLYNLHRDAEQFPDPERFDPDRFLPGEAERRHPFAYIPFSAGSRNCIGQKFAMLEIKTLLTQLLLTYRLEAVTTLEELQPIADLVLHSMKPIRVKFLNRTSEVPQAKRRIAG